MMTQERDLGLWFRVALISLLGAIAIAIAGTSPAMAQAGGLSKETALGRMGDTGWIQLVNTASSGQSTTRVGFRGTVMLCGHSRVSSRDITCTETSTNVQPSPYMAQLQILLNDGNDDDTLTWDDVDLTIVCDNVFGESEKYTYTDQDLTETAAVLGADSTGRTPYCKRIRSLRAVNNDSSATPTDYLVTDSSDSVRLALTDVVVPPIAPLRSSSVGGLHRNIDSICFRGDVGEDINVWCTKANQCTTTLISGGRKGVAIDISSCFSGSGDVTDATAAMIEGSFARIVGKAGLY